uniref:Uncharacterized protein n=1 Tax=Emiliania huxleyi TaxID=2903 RepID=A0A7S3SMV4_EMIHU
MHRQVAGLVTMDGGARSASVARKAYTDAAFTPGRTWPRLVDALSHGEPHDAPRTCPGRPHLCAHRGGALAVRLRGGGEERSPPQLRSLRAATAAVSPLQVSWRVVSAKEWLPQQRERVYLVGFRRDLGIEMRWGRRARRQVINECGD